MEITDGKRLSSKEIECAISDRGCRLAPYPEDIDLDVIEVTDGNPPQWSVSAPVYTEQEGLSDLSVEPTVIEDGHSNYKVEFDDLHVL